jgi:hypothetical protein
MSDRSRPIARRIARPIARMAALAALTACHMPTDRFHGLDAGEDAPGGDGPGGSGSDAGPPAAVCPNMHFTLSPPALITGTKPVAVTAADLNDDHLPDLVVANSGDGTVSVLLNESNPSGTVQFKVHQDYQTCQQAGMCAAANPRAVAIGRLDANTWPDIVVANYKQAGSPGSLGVLLNKGGATGGGTFPANATEYNTDGNPESVVAADLDGDKYADLVVAEFNVSGKVGVLMNSHSVNATGNGTFGARTDTPTAPSGGPIAVTVADVDDNSTPDVIVADRDVNAVSVLNGLGDGELFPSTDHYSTGDQPMAVAVAKLVRHRSVPDIVVVTAGDNLVNVLLNDGTGGFPDTRNAVMQYPTGRTPRAVAAADLDGDGIIDLVVANQDDNNVSVLLGNGDGTFQPQKAFPDQPAPGLAPQGIAVADVNGDGHPDIIVANSGNNTLSILLGSCGP